MVYVHQFSLSPSSSEKKNKVGETLRRIYFGNCKSLLIFRAGLHHRGITILNSCSCSYSLSSSTTQLKLNKTLQSIDFSGFFFPQTHYFSLPIIQFFVGQQNKWSFLFQLDAYILGLQHLYLCAYGIHLDSCVRWFIFFSNHCDV